MGRLTPSFRRLLLAEIERLYTRFRPALRNPLLQEAFDALIRVWSGESAGMMVSTLSLPLEAMNLLANIHIRTEVERLTLRCTELEVQASLLHANEKGSDGSE